MLAAIYTNKIHIKKFGESFFYKVALVLTHKTLVNKNAGELLADCTGKQACCNRTVYTARQAQNYMLVADFFTKLFNSIVDKIIHNPVA